MKKRCILIFPEFENVDAINKIRKVYDPLCDKVRPHITLVFPFESYLNTEELKNYLLETLKETKAFKISLYGIVKVQDKSGNYLFLKVIDGKEDLIGIHNNLYKNILKEHKPEWLNNVEFIPHMTIGSFNNKKSLENAYKETCNIQEVFNTVVKKISVEIIDESELSILEMEIELKQ
ncbi:2'-5' RNA ligase family protein [Clostridium sp. CTA-19]